MKPAVDISDGPETLLIGGLSSSSLGAAPAAMSLAARQPSRLSDFYELTKPRMNFLVVVTTMVGYYMATESWGDWRRLLHTLIGTALTAAGASVLNQFAERDFDALMPRTKDRPLPARRMGAAEALAFGAMLSICGVVELALFVNPLTALLGAITLAIYVFVYTPLKRFTTICTIVGAVPGAIPPMMGVTAATGHFTPAAIALFLILFIWQMPHFLAIAILYKDDYAAGGFKMLPVVDEGLASTSRQIVVYSLTLIPISLMPALMQVAGTIYFLAAVIMGLGFLGFGVLCAVRKTRADARQLFFASIVYLPCLLGAMMIDKL
jgi:protoheme IX farnesyltransferase